MDDETVEELDDSRDERKGSYKLQFDAIQEEAEEE